MNSSIRNLTALLLALLLLSIPISAMDVSAQAAILIEAESGDVLFARREHDRLPMASTTKIMTAVVALEHADLDRIVEIPAKACGVEGSSLYLKPGERLTMRDLLYGLMLQSANDAAAAIAYAVSGGIEAFAEEMNATAVRLGLRDTHFTNPHGLDDEQHYTTAADLAALTAYALRNETFAKIVSTKQYTLAGGTTPRTVVNHNRLLRMSDSVIGVKTGFTRRCGRCLVSAAREGAVTVIAVTLNAPDDWQDHLALHELGLSAYTTVSFGGSAPLTAEIPCPYAPDGILHVSTDESVSVPVKNGAAMETVIECPHLWLQPVAEGDEVGRAVLLIDGKETASLPLFAESTVTLPEEKSAFSKLFDLFE